MRTTSTLQSTDAASTGAVTTIGTDAPEDQPRRGKAAAGVLHRGRR